MIAATDYVGLSAAISALGAAIVGIIVAMRQQGTKDAVKEVHDAVRTSNGATIGQLAEAGELRRVEHEPPGGPA